MNFEWDEAKNDVCFAERGFDFTYAARTFFDPNRLIQADTRHSHDEDRYQLMGRQDCASPVCGGLYTHKRHHPHHFGTQSQPTRGQAL